MKVLLDSHAVYWWTIGSDRLSLTARSMIEDKANTILVSAVSFYELDDKMRLKKLHLRPQELRAAVADSGVQTLAITDLHAELTASVDWESPRPLGPPARGPDAAGTLRVCLRRRRLRQGAARTGLVAFWLN